MLIKIRIHIMNNVIKAIKKIQFRLSDIFLGIWFVFGMIIFYESNSVMGSNNVNNLYIPIWVHSIFFIVFIISFSIYFYLEKKRINDNKILLLLFITIFLIISQAEVIFLHPNIIIQWINNSRGEPFLVTTQINNEIKLIHFFAISFMLLGFFAGVFIIPKRIKSIKFLYFIFNILFLVSIGIFIYSLIFDNYILLFQKIFSINSLDVHIEACAPKGIFSNKNMYAVFIELCLFVSLINYSLTKRKYNLVLTIFYYLHLLLTLSWAGIISSTIVLFLSIIVHFILFIRNKNRKGIIITSSILSLALSAIIIFVLLLSFNESFRFYITWYKGERSFNERKGVWLLSIQIIKNAPFFNGSGYGIYNHILLNANIIATDYHYPIATSHSWFLSIMGRGGLIMLLSFISLLIVSIYDLIKIYKTNKEATIALASCQLVFFIHSSIDDPYYLII